jgi:hypothetical protein
MERIIEGLHEPKQLGVAAMVENSPIFPGREGVTARPLRASLTTGATGTTGAPA